MSKAIMWSCSLLKKIATFHHIVAFHHIFSTFNCQIFSTFKSLYHPRLFALQQLIQVAFAFGCYGFFQL